MKGSIDGGRFGPHFFAHENFTLMQVRRLEPAGQIKDEQSTPIKDAMTLSDTFSMVTYCATHSMP